MAKNQKFYCHVYANEYNDLPKKQEKLDRYSF